jgi:hypothetical protein
MHLKGSRDKSVSFCLIFHEIVLTACGDVSIGAFMKADTFSTLPNTIHETDSSLFKL